MRDWQDLSDGELRARIEQRHGFGEIIVAAIVRDRDDEVQAELITRLLGQE